MSDQAKTTPEVLDENAQILALQEELDCATRSRNDFLLGMSHRVRTPLSGVLGMMELLSNSELAADQRSYVTNARDAGRSLMKVLDELLDYCRVQAGELVLSREEFSPAQVAMDVLGEFATIAQEEGVLLTTCSSPEVPATIEGDPARLRQVLGELLENSLRFTTEGQVQIGVRPVMDQEEWTKLLFWVEDTGPGISQDALVDIFNFTFESEGSREMSIGLPAARHLVEAMGGDINVESEVGHGTTIRFTLPIVPGWSSSDVCDLETTPVQVLSLDEDRRAARVLVVEDDLVNQRVTMGYLKLAGYEGFVVASGDEALKVLATEEFDLILMDKMMPGMDGIGATRAIRAGEGDVLNPNIPIIALTAEVSVEARRECLGAGMNDYLTKPIRKKEIDPVIRAWLPPHLRPSRAA